VAQLTLPQAIIKATHQRNQNMSQAPHTLQAMLLPRHICRGWLLQAVNKAFL
jgi:hypothetical protein